MAVDGGRTLRFKERRIPCRILGLAINGLGTDKRQNCYRVPRTIQDRFNRRELKSPSSSANVWMMSRFVCGVWTILSSRGGLPVMGACTMRLLRFLALFMFLGSTAVAQSPTYGVGSTPSEEEIRAWDIAISPTGEELPPGRGTSKEGELVYRRQCASCHGVDGEGAGAPRLVKRDESQVDPWDYGRILAIRSPYATGVWDYINRGMPVNREGTLTADQVYALTAYLLYLNDVISEDDVVDDQNLAKIEMPNRNNFADLPDWKRGMQRFPGYPF